MADLIFTLISFKNIVFCAGFFISKITVRKNSMIAIASAFLLLEVTIDHAIFIKNPLYLLVYHMNTVAIH